MSSIPSLARLRLESLALCLLAVPLFTLGLWEQPFIGFDGRFALFAQEMFRHGASAFPTSYGQPYPDYPATSTLLIDVFAQLFGEVNRLATLIPTALASAAIVGLLYRLLAERSRAWGLLAVLVLLLTNGFLAKARSICLDQFVTLAALGCFYLLWSADQRGLSRRRYTAREIFLTPIVGAIAAAYMTEPALFYLRAINWPLPDRDITATNVAAFVVGICGMWVSDLIFEIIARWVRGGTPG